RDVRVGLVVRIDVILFDVPGDADDFYVGNAAFTAAKGKVRTNWRTLWEETLGKGLADDCHLGAVLGVRSTEFAAGNQRDSERGKVSRAQAETADVLELFRNIGVALDSDIARANVAPENREIGGTDTGNAGIRGEPTLQLIDESDSAGIGIAGEAGGKRKRHYAVGFDAEIGLAQIPERLRIEACSGKNQHGECDLRRDEELAQPDVRAACGGVRGLFLESVRDFGACHAPCGNEAKNRDADHRHEES